MIDFSYIESTGYERALLNILLSKDNKRSAFSALSDVVMVDKPDIRLKEYEALFDKTTDNLHHILDRCGAFSK